MLPLKNQVPLLRLLLPFLGGILWYVYIPLPIPFWLFLLAGMVAFITLVQLSVVRIPYNYRWINGFFLHAVFFVLGYQLTHFNTEMEYASHYSKVWKKGNAVVIKVTDPGTEKERSVKTVAEVIAVQQNGKWIATTGKAVTYFRKDSSALSVKYGDLLIALPAFKEIDPPANPEEFNYRQYLSFHNINRQCFLPLDKWKPLGANWGNYIIGRSIELRNYFLDIFKKYKITGDEFAVGSALVLGYEDKLNPAIVSAYAGSGALHVLSVSGLHIAIIYVVFLKLLFFFDRYRHGHIIKAILLVIFLWFYSCITGLSPSVMRAATMFSFIVIGKAFNRYTNIYNTLAASAFFLLIIDPYLIMEVGFQLSYLAVLGIVLLQPGIYGLWKTDSWLADQVWTVTSVSIAAQVATFPLGLLYFHQFPNYFLLSNLVVIPVSGLILYAGIALLVFAKLPLLGAGIAWLLVFLLKFLNYSVTFFEKAPYSMVQGVSIGIAETWIIYLAITGIFLFFVSKNAFYLRSSLALFIVLFAYQVVERNNEVKNSRLVVYSINKTMAIDFMEGKRNYFLADSVLTSNKSTMLFHVYHNWWEMGIDEHTYITGDYKRGSFSRKGNFIRFRKKKLLIDDEKLVLTSPPANRMKIDYIVLGKNSKHRIKELLAYFDCDYFILDSSCTSYSLASWKKQCLALNRKCYPVSEKGALVLEI